MQVLVIGGTRYVGRHLAGALLELGHDLTFFHRGETNPDLFPEVDRVFGDRETDLDRLGDRTWDVVIDTCGYTPEHVDLAVEYLRDRADRYVFISSAAVYEPTSEPRFDETAAVQTEPPAGDGVEWWHTEYARHKVACEAIVLDAFGESNSLVIRPGMVIGPHDPVGYFPYWAVRLWRGGDVLVPDVRDQPLQLIDVRDLAAFTSEMVDQSVNDVFTVDGPAEPLTFGAAIETLRDQYRRESTLHWVETEWLLDHDVTPPWKKLPYWLPGDAVDGYCRKSTEKARRHGLESRPLAETAADVIDWYRRADVGEREGWDDGLPPGRGLGPDEEAELLAAYAGG